MDRIDALGPRPDRHEAFTRRLLSEIEDEQLQAIVEEAARDLSTPIALVNLVLEQIQFFKAHYGLPADLEAARGTDRDVSFCQFVVRDGKPFEVNDALTDDRVPQYLVEQYGIRAYLGIPVIANDIVVGSLCVIDFEPRQFSVEERRNLEKLANLVNARLEALGEQHLQSPSSLTDRVAAPAITGLRNSLAPIQEKVGAGKMAATAIGLSLRLADHGLNGGKIPPGSMEVMMKAGRKALEDCKNALFDIEERTTEAERTLAALERLFNRTAAPHLLEVTRSGVELARKSLADGVTVTLDETGEDDPRIATPRPLGVSLISTCLTMVAAHLTEEKADIRLAVRRLGDQAEVVISTDQLPNATFPEIAAAVSRHTGEDPTLRVQAIEGAIRLSFSLPRDNRLQSVALPH